MDANDQWLQHESSLQKIKRGGDGEKKRREDEAAESFSSFH